MIDKVLILVILSPAVFTFPPGVRVPKAASSPLALDSMVLSVSERTIHGCKQLLTMRKTQ